MSILLWAPRLTQAEQSEPRVQAGATQAPAPASEDESDAHDTNEAEREADQTVLGAEVDLNSRFIWRGLAFSRGAALQPSAWVSAFGFSASLWSSFMLGAELPRRRPSSLVPSLHYEYIWKRLTLEPGATIYYNSDELGPSMTAEASLDAAFDLGSGVHLVVTDNVDLKAQAGAYFGTLGARYERAFGRCTARVSTGFGFASATWNSLYLDTRRPTLSLVEGALSLRYDLTESVYGTLHVESSSLLAPALRHHVAEPTLWNNGLTLGIEL